MCGIVGVLGKKDVAPLLVEALKRLEYRGYDSSGIATVHNGKLEDRKSTRLNFSHLDLSRMPSSA